MTFRELHRGSEPLVLPNAWDVASAMALHEAGFAAIGTTSLGVAAAHGLGDAARAAREVTRELAGALRRLPCPISVDVEDGFADDPGEVAAYVASLGVDGVNIEDSTRGRLVAPEVHAAKVTAVKDLCPEVFVNARVDTFWLGVDSAVEWTLDRAARYVEAGADGIFVPGALSPTQVEAITASVPVPVNVLASATLSIPDLAACGVRRVSTGSLLYRAALGRAVEVAVAVRDGQAPPGAMSYAEVEALTGRYAAGPE